MGGPGMGGPGEHRHAFYPPPGMRMQGGPFGKGTFLRFDRDGGVTVKCADDEPTKSCMEALAPVIDKLKPQR